MDELLKKKINLLVHVAKADGKFHPLEKEFLHKILSISGLNDFELDGLPPAENVSGITKKEELLFWAIQLIKIDGQIHPNEIAHCKELAIKLGFMPAIIDLYQFNELPSFEAFKSEAENYRFNF